MDAARVGAGLCTLAIRARAPPHSRQFGAVAMEQARQAPRLPNPLPKSDGNLSYAMQVQMLAALRNLGSLLGDVSQ